MSLPKGRWAAMQALRLLMVMRSPDLRMVRGLRRSRIAVLVLAISAAKANRVTVQHRMQLDALERRINGDAAAPPSKTIDLRSGTQDRM